MSESEYTPSPPQSGSELRKQKQTQRTIDRKAIREQSGGKIDRKALREQSGGGTPSKKPSPSLTTPAKNDHDDLKQYLTIGLPNVPKNPKTGKTVPYATAVQRIKTGHYGAENRRLFQEATGGAVTDSPVEAASPSDAVAGEHATTSSTEETTPTSTESPTDETAIPDTTVLLRSSTAGPSGTANPTDSLEPAAMAPTNEAASAAPTSDPSVTVDLSKTEKRILFCAARNFHFSGWTHEERDARMKEIVLSEGKAGDRFDYILSNLGDRDLQGQTLGAETKDCYSNNGNANGTTYEQCYGEQVVAIHRYMQQGGAFGFLPVEKMKKLVFFFRFNIFGLCYLAALCVFASYVGQMAFELNHVIFPPDVGRLIRSFKDEDLFDFIVKDAGGDSNDALRDMLNGLGQPNPGLQVDNKDTFAEEYDLQRRLKRGPGLVTNFMCTPEFHQAFQENPVWKSKKDKNNVTIGYIRFDMQAGQEFEKVEGKFIKLAGDNNTVELKDKIEEAKTKTQTGATGLNDLVKTNVQSPIVGRGGDKSAHVCSPESSVDSVQTSSHHDRAAPGHNNAALDDSRDFDDESIEALRDESSQLPVRDRPPAENDENDGNESRHAAVCIAGRKDENGKTYLLLQNSWPRMPLVEVSLNYFVAAGGRLTFVATDEKDCFKQLAEKNCPYKVNKAFVADCSVP